MKDIELTKVLFYVLLMMIVFRFKPWADNSIDSLSAVRSVGGLQVAVSGESTSRCIPDSSKSRLTALTRWCRTSTRRRHFTPHTAFTRTRGTQWRLNGLIGQVAHQRRETTLSLWAQTLLSFVFFCLLVRNKRQKIMGIDILSGLPQNFIGKKNKKKLSWILKRVRGGKQRLRSSV